MFMPHLGEQSASGAKARRAAVLRHIEGLILAGAPWPGAEAVAEAVRVVGPKCVLKYLREEEAVVLHRNRKGEVLSVEIAGIGRSPTLAKPVVKPEGNGPAFALVSATRKYPPLPLGLSRLVEDRAAYRLGLAAQAAAGYGPGSPAIEAAFQRHLAGVSARIGG